MWKPLIVCAVAALVLAGCASTPTVEVEKPAAVEETEAAPLTAEQPSAEEAAGTPEEQYLERMHARLAEDRTGIDATQIANASDEQLLDAGGKACAQLAEGKMVDQVRVIADEEPNEIGYFVDSMSIAVAAEETLC